MEQHRWSQLDYYYDFITGVTIPRDHLRVQIFESFALKKRLSNNSKDYSYNDYKISLTQYPQWVQDFIRDHFRVQYEKTLCPMKAWGIIYGPMEQSYNRNQVNPLELKSSPDYTWIYGVEVQPGSCELVVEYDDNRRKANTWHFPLENNKFIMFPSTQRYFITKNKSPEMNVFLSVNCEALLTPV